MSDKISYPESIDIYGTLGPACMDPDVLREMFACGMTGIRINLSHTSLKASAGKIEMVKAAAAACGIEPKILIDMQGPEIRLPHEQVTGMLTAGEDVVLLAPEKKSGAADSKAAEATAGYKKDAGKVYLPIIVFSALQTGTQLLLDDGKLLLEVTEVNGDTAAFAKVLRGGLLQGGKSVAVVGQELPVPAMTEQDRENIALAEACGVTALMQPFVRSAGDLQEVREALDAAGAENIRLLAKIENLSGVDHLESFFPLADEIVIARGDLGNAMPLWELPAMQAELAERCRTAGKPFMVVTQMLASMEHSAVPTRAEVSDIYRAVREGASSVMVTGETAVGEYPVEVIRYLVNTVRASINTLKSSWNE